MVYDQFRFERFAMQAEKMSLDPSLQTGTDIDLYGIEILSVGKALDLAPEESKQLAHYLQDIGWAKLSGVNGPRLRLTPVGFREIAKLRRPAWRRWVDEHPITMNVFWMIVASTVSGIICTVITYHLLKPN